MGKKFFLPVVCCLIAIAVLATASDTSASPMAQAQKGKILLQVEMNGEAWYVNPANENRYFMGRPDDAFDLMRRLGVGIKNSDLAKITIGLAPLNGPDSDGDGLSDLFEDAIGTDKNNPDSDGDGFSDKDEVLSGHNPLGQGKMPIDQTFAHKQKGRIFLQVENSGEAWYVNPTDGKRYFMGRPADAFSLMRSLGLGITNENINKIPVSSVSAISTGDTSVHAIKYDPRPIDAALTADISKHQAQIKEFIALYSAYKKADYDAKAAELFSAKSQKTAQDITNEFTMSFIEYTLKKIADMDLNEEYAFANEDEEIAQPYEKINDDTIIIGLGLHFANPYYLIKEKGGWKIDLEMAKDYYTESEKISNLALNSDGSEVEVYLMGKIESALKAYKKATGNYPRHLHQVLPYYPALNLDIDDFYYASIDENSPMKCHFGIEIEDDNSKLKNDADFDSLSTDYLNGFEGDDPIYDKVLN